MSSNLKKEESFFKLPSTALESKQSYRSKKLPFNYMVITPNNIQMIFNLMDYLSRAKVLVDMRLLEIMIKITRKFSQFNFRGFMDIERAKSSFELKFYLGLDMILSNKFISIKFHATMK